MSGIRWVHLPTGTNLGLFLFIMYEPVFKESEVSISVVVGHECNRYNVHEKGDPNTWLREWFAVGVKKQLPPFSAWKARRTRLSKAVSISSIGGMRSSLLGGASLQQIGKQRGIITPLYYFGYPKWTRSNIKRLKVSSDLYFPEHGFWITLKTESQNQDHWRCIGPWLKSSTCKSVHRSS